MCMLCDDEKNYQAYMTYLDEIERRGKGADADKAMDAMMAAMIVNTPAAPAPDLTLSTHYPSPKKPAAAPPSPFFCSPVDK